MKLLVVLLAELIIATTQKNFPGFLLMQAHHTVLRSLSIQYTGQTHLNIHTRNERRGLEA